MDAEDTFSWAHDILHQTDQGPADEDPTARVDRLELRGLTIRTMNEIALAHTLGMSYSTVTARFLELCLRLHNTVRSEAGCPICSPPSGQLA